MPECIRFRDDEARAGAALAIGLDGVETAVIGIHVAAARASIAVPARRGMIEAMAARAGCVVTRLVGEGWDAIELAEWLAAAGFRGLLVVVIPRLPRPEMVAREIAATCPGAEVALMPLAHQ